MRNNEHIWFLLLLIDFDKSYTLITIERDTNSNFTLELVTLKHTFQTINNRGKDTLFQHGHSQLDQNNHLDDIDPFLHIKFIRHPEIQYTLGTHLRSSQIDFINRLIDAKSHTT